MSWPNASGWANKVVEKILSAEATRKVSFVLEKGQAVPIVLFLLSWNLFLVACGGGGGNGDTTAESLSYAGKTSQARITENNAKKLMVELQSLGQGRGVPLPFKPSRESTQRDHFLQIYHIVQTLRSAGSATSDLKGEKPLAQEAVIEGTCPENPGRVVVNSVFDEETGDFEGEARYEAFCVEGWTFTGPVSQKGNEKNDNVTITLNELTAVNGDVSFTMKGEVTFEEEELKINSVVRDDATERIYQVQDYKIEHGGFAAKQDERDGESGDLFDLSGRFYDPDEGYIEMETTNSFGIVTGDAFPSFGVMEATGSVGSKARLTAASSTEFKVEADADGDGVFEFSTGNTPWTE